MKGNEDKWNRMIGSEADLRVRSERRYVCQAIILFVQSQWPVPIGPGPDFICLSWSLSVGTYFSEGPFSMPSGLCSFHSVPHRWLTHWKADLVLCSAFPGPSTVAQTWALRYAGQDELSSYEYVENKYSLSVFWYLSLWAISWWLDTHPVSYPSFQWLKKKVSIVFFYWEAERNENSVCLKNCPWQQRSLMLVPAHGWSSGVTYS